MKHHLGLKEKLVIWPLLFFCTFIVPGTFSPFCAWHLFPFLCLAPFPLFVPGTFSPFCAWHLFPFLCLAPFPLF
ncbi:hypothetical protein, partial [Rossellomorea marisflavi]|uniref:hypothetical protein n=1 Tax=Rossellomorea marisflavi TaxID=189381 RepID=UPI003CF989C6